MICADPSHSQECGCNLEESGEAADRRETGRRFALRECYFSRPITNLIRGIRKRMIRTMAIHLNDRDFGRGNS